MAEVFLDREFTIMVLPDARSRLRRFHLRGRHLVAGVACGALVALAALVAPVLLVWGAGLEREVDRLAAQRDQLAARADEVDATLGELRRRLDRFETRTQKLATIAGLDLPPLAAPGQGHATEIDPDQIGARADLLRREAEELADRGALLERRLDTLGRALARQSERLSRIPTLVPVRGLIGSGFGWRRDPFTGLRQFHRGIDFSAPEGTPVRAPADGIVIKAERHGGYGNTLYVSHGEGIVTRYGHLSRIEARPGQKVRRGEIIALVGSSGRSTAPHLHYEILRDGQQVDPMQWIVEDGLF